MQARARRYALLALLLAGLPVLLVGAESAATEDVGEDEQACEAQGTCGASKASTDSDTPFVCDFVEKLDFYERLGVAKDADDRSLKKAYRKAGQSNLCCYASSSRVMT